MIKQHEFRSDSPPKDSAILGRMKPNNWPQLVIWSGEGWRQVGRDKVYPADSLSEWAYLLGE